MDACRAPIDGSAGAGPADEAFYPSPRPPTLAWPAWKGSFMAEQVPADPLGRTDYFARVCTRYLLSLNRRPEVVGRAWIEFDADDLQKGMLSGRTRCHLVEGKVELRQCDLFGCLSGSGNAV
ncbi:unnamed protein product [marine sediment metagenome]|uniref:Uncharacterized protein n=1 Tax=marine sediment metagenome TaxID=412755 RepID=X0RQ39_9ZZZZ